MRNFCRSHSYLTLDTRAGFVVAGPGYTRSSLITEVVPGHVAIATAKDIVDACVTGFMYFFREFPGGDPNARPLFMIKAKIFGHQSPNLLSLAAAMDNVIGVEPDVREHAIWQCAIMRNTYDPVDMVFSIMGLFGVTLPVKAFAKRDRIGATIALARKILESGKSASWLGISFRLPPCRYLGTFPIFPHTGLAEKALVRTKDGFQEMAEFMDCEFPNADALQSGMPTGTMDNAGYFTFTSRFAHVVPELQQSESSSVVSEYSMKKKVLSSNAILGLACQGYRRECVEGDGFANYTPAHFRCHYRMVQRVHTWKDAGAPLLLDQSHACTGTCTWEIPYCALRSDKPNVQKGRHEVEHTPVYRRRTRSTTRRPTVCR